MKKKKASFIVEKMERQTERTRGSGRDERRLGGGGGQ